MWLLMYNFLAKVLSGILLNGHVAVIFAGYVL